MFNSNYSLFCFVIFVRIEEFVYVINVVFFVLICCMTCCFLLFIGFYLCWVSLFMFSTRMSVNFWIAATDAFSLWIIASLNLSISVFSVLFSVFVLICLLWLIVSVVFGVSSLSNIGWWVVYVIFVLSSSSSMVLLSSSILLIFCSASSLWFLTFFARSLNWVFFVDLVGVFFVGGIFLIRKDDLFSVGSLAIFLTLWLSSLIDSRIFFWISSFSARVTIW